VWLGARRLPRADLEKLRTREVTPALHDSPKRIRSTPISFEVRESSGPSLEVALGEAKAKRWTHAAQLTG